MSLRHGLCLATLLCASVAWGQSVDGAIHTEDSQLHVFPGGISLPGPSGVELLCNEIVPPAAPATGEACYCKAGAGMCCKDAAGSEHCPGGGGGGGVTQINQGTGITLTPNPIVGTGTVAVTLEKLLNATIFSDVVANTVAQGDLIIGNATPAWTVLAPGANNTALTANGTTESFTTINDATLANPYSGVGSCGANTFATTLTRNAAPTCSSVSVSGLIAPKVHLLNTTLFDDVTAGTPAASGDLMVANGSKLWTDTALTGDSTITGAGVMTNTALQGTAVSVTPPTNAQILVSNATPKWNPVTVSGDSTITNAGVMTNTKINNVSCLAGGDCLPQYLLLAGRTGGQTANGGTATTDSLTLQGTANGTPATTSTVDIVGTNRIDGAIPTNTDARTTFYAPTNASITADSMLIEMFRGTTTVGTGGVIRGIAPRHFNGTTNGAKFVFTGNPLAAGTAEMYTEDADYWNQTNTSITAGPFTAYGDGRKFNIDASAANSPTFTINNGIAHAVNSGVNTQGVQLTTSCNGGGCTGTPTGTIQEWDGMELGQFAACQAPWTITSFVGQFQNSPGGTCTVVNETGMDVNLTQGQTRISMISRDPGTTMRHAGRTIAGAITVPQAVVDAVASSTNPIATQSDFTGTTGANQVIGTNSFAGTVEINNASGAVIGYAFPGTVQLDAGLASGNYAQTSLRTVKNQSGTAVTSILLGALTNQETITANNAALTLNDSGGKPSYVGYENIPTFNRVGTPSSTAQTVVGDHLGGVVNAGWTVTTWDALKADPPTINGAVTTLVGLDLGNMTGATTNLSLRSTGGSMVHQGNVRIGDTANVPTHPLELTTTATNGVILETVDDSAAAPGVAANTTGIQLFGNGLNLGSGAAVTGLSAGGTWTFNAAPSGFGFGDFMVYSPTLKNANATAITAKGLEGFAVTPTFQGDGAALTLQAFGSNDAPGGYLFSPTFNVINAGTVTADNVVGFHSVGSINTGATVTNFTPVKISPLSAITGTVTNLVGVDIGALTGAGTLNAGMRCAVAAGANNMCIQGTGTADSRLLGDLVIGSSSQASNALVHVTGGTIGNNVERQESGNTGTPLPSQRTYFGRGSQVGAGVLTQNFSLTANAPNDAPCPTSTGCVVHVVTVCHCTGGTSCTGAALDASSANQSDVLVKNSAGTITLQGAVTTSQATQIGSASITSIAVTVSSPNVVSTVTGIANFNNTCNFTYTVYPVGT